VDLVRRSYGTSQSVRFFSNCSKEQLPTDCAIAENLYVAISTDICPFQYIRIQRPALLRSQVSLSSSGRRRPGDQEFLPVIRARLTELLARFSA
jgi:hypothetical protein